MRNIPIQENERKCIYMKYIYANTIYRKEQENENKTNNDSLCQYITIIVKSKM
jgi:hypothetical protein